jgi:hypothetical protein
VPDDALAGRGEENMKVMIAMLLLATAALWGGAAQSSIQPPEDKVTIELDKVPIQDALRQLFRAGAAGRMSGKRVRFSIERDVQGTVAVRLKDAPFEAALKMMVRQVNAQFIRVGNRYRIVLCRMTGAAMVVRQISEKKAQTETDKHIEKAAAYKPAAGTPYKVSRAEKGLFVDVPDEPFVFRAQIREGDETGKVIDSWYFVGTWGGADAAGAASFQRKDAAVFLPDRGAPVIVIDVLWGDDLQSWTHEIWRDAVVTGVVTKEK